MAAAAVSPPSNSRVAALVLAAWTALVLTALAWWSQREQSRSPQEIQVYVSRGVGLPIVLPSDPNEGEREAAELLADTLGEASGLGREGFPRFREGETWQPAGPALWIGRRTSFGRMARGAVGHAPWEPQVGYRVSREGVLFEATDPDHVVFAASWFLERELRARWFMPGKLGLELERPKRLVLAKGDHFATPGFLSRDLGSVADSREGARWYRANRLIRLVEHGHTVARLLGKTIREEFPELAPEIDGATQLPTESARFWQPNLAHPMAATIAARALNAEIARKPTAFNLAFGLNDGIGFDQSAATLAAVSPVRYFRGLPDYSDLLFGFMNRVADALPDRFISTYAYQWTENAPQFPVASNVVPLLTADRSNWIDAKFAQEDRELIRRWTRAGPRLVGLYDYLYGAPYFVPRPTLWAVTEPIAFAHRSGVKAFYAEAYPNWGLDGPKLWLAAQLLWNPSAEASVLLDEYYERFWAEAAVPMRAFFEQCDTQWRGQPRPLTWIKYFKDDHQRVLFPPDIRANLAGLLREAASRATDQRVKARVDMVRAAFAVTEAFCFHAERREAVLLALLAGDRSARDLAGLTREFAEARRALQRVRKQVRVTTPLALRAELIDEYLREDPRARVVLELSRRGELAALPRDAWPEGWGDARGWDSDERELLQDADFRTVQQRRAPEFALLNWIAPPSPWQSYGEPAERRRIELIEEGATRRIRFSGASFESLGQAIAVRGGEYYAASLQVRGQVSPGNDVSLHVGFFDANGRRVGRGGAERLPIGHWPREVTLQVASVVPRGAVRMHVALRVSQQMNDDFLEISAASLRALRLRN